MAQSRAVSSSNARVTANGTQLYYERRGAGPHVILCMPGAMGTAETDFSPQLEYFGREGGGFTAVSFDPRGYGKSRPPSRVFQTTPEHFLKTDALDAESLMRALGFSSYSILGWSDGGISAVLLAALFPSAVRSMVLWGASAYISKEDIKLFETTRDVSKWSARMREPLEAVYGEDFQRMWSDWTDSMAEVNSSKLTREPPSEEIQGDLCVKELSAVKCPTLIVHGVKDPLCPLFHAEFLARKIKGSKLELMAEGKHNLHLRYHEEFNKMVEIFMSSSD